MSQFQVDFLANRFKDQTLLITGFARGIGRAVALRAAKEGARIFGLDVLKDEAIETVGLILDAGGEVDYWIGDVSEASACAEAVSRAVKSFGRLDLAVNSAGIMDGADPGDQPSVEKQRDVLFAPIHEASDAYWRRVVDVNLSGAFYSMRAELKQMVRQGRGGAIVNVGSVAGINGLAMNPAYVASKHGLIGLTKNAAIDYARYGIRVNSVNMAATDTPMYSRTVRVSTGLLHENPSYAMPKMKSQSLQMQADRDLRPSSVWQQASTILYLLSNEAAHMTGANVACDGGWTTY